MKDDSEDRSTFRLESHTVLPGLLVVAVCAFNLLCQPTRSSLPAIWQMFAAAGVIVPATWLAIWASMAAFAARSRISAGLFALFLFLGSFTCTFLQSNGGSVRNSVNIVLGLIFQFGVTFVVLSVLRRLTRWELRPGQINSQNAKSQISIVTLLVWTFEAALIIGLLTYLNQLAQRENPPGEGLILKFALNQGLTLAGFASPSVPLAWIVLAKGRARVVGSAIFVISLIVLVLTFGQIYRFGPANPFAMATTLAVGIAAWGIAIAAVMRVAGYRLVRARQPAALPEKTETGRG